MQKSCPTIGECRGRRASGHSRSPKPLNVGIVDAVHGGFNLVPHEPDIAELMVIQLLSSSMRACARWREC
jgi:hypothetical protein